MKLSFLTLSPDERRLYIEQAAIRRNMSPVLLEKDFWVCWLLGHKRTILDSFAGTSLRTASFFRRSISLE